MPILLPGDGSDGDITFAVNTDLNTTDMPAHAVTGMGPGYVDVDDTTGLSVGDEVLLINTRGTLVGTEGPAGHHETFNILGIDTLRITFDGSQQLFYGDGGTSNDNISTHPVQLQRVPNYNNVTINAGVNVYPSATGRADTPGGVLFMRVLNTMTINGTLHATSKGGDGGFYPDPNQGGLGVGGGAPSANGQGGAYALQGNTGWPLGINTNTYGDQEITNLHIGSGGARGVQTSTTTSCWGSDGGGAICVHATTLEITGTGSILCNSTNAHSSGSWGGGSGSGGSIKLIVGTYNQSGTLAATSGATGGSYAGGGGKGSVGRIAVYANVFNSSPSSTPTAYTAEATLPYFVSGILSEDALVRIYDADTGILITTHSGVTGSYEIATPSTGPFDIVGKPVDTESGALIFRDVVSEQH